MCATIYVTDCISLFAFLFLRVFSVYLKFVCHKHWFYPVLNFACFESPLIFHLLQALIFTTSPHHNLHVTMTSLFIAVKPDAERKFAQPPCSFAVCKNITTQRPPICPTSVTVRYFIIPKRGGGTRVSLPARKNLSPPCSYYQCREF